MNKIFSCNKKIITLNQCHKKVKIKRAIYSDGPILNKQLLFNYSTINF